MRGEKQMDPRHEGLPAAGHGVYAISVAAEPAGIGVQTLRLYQQHGLLTPARNGEPDLLVQGPGRPLGQRGPLPLRMLDVLHRRTAGRVVRVLDARGRHRHRHQ